jgi:ATP-dependent helicase HrpB
MPERLPIHEVAGEIVSALERGNRLLLRAPTGSGKSTQVPQILLNAGLLETGELWVLQPRRIAARLLGRRVAEELGSRLGEVVGYQMRLETKVSAATKVRFVTEGILLRRLLGDPHLRGIAAIAFDEFHERHLQSDVGLALCKRLQESSRPDLRVLVMSATIETGGRLAEYMAPAETVVSEGRSFPVEIGYAPPPAPPPQRQGVRTSGPPRTGIWDHAAEVCARAYGEGERGDTLIFMPGAYEIRRTLAALEARGLGKRAVLLPLHGELPPQAQDEAVARYDRPKIVVATNVAETSLTIDGITLVIDGGQARVARFDPQRGMDTLLVEPISQDSATQRAGRAGRTRAGRCLRLWSEAENERRAPHLAPEVRRVDLCELVLSLRAMPRTRDYRVSLAATEDRSRLFLDEPDPVAWLRAEHLLRALGALGADGAITPVGRLMLEFPVPPRLARMLLHGVALVHAKVCHRGLLPLLATIAGLLQERSIWLRSGHEIDHARDQALGVEQFSDLLLAVRGVEWASQRDFDPQDCGRLGIHGGSARAAWQSAGRYASMAGQEYEYEDAGHFAAMLEGVPLEELKGREPEELARHCLLVAFSDQLARRVSQGQARYDLPGGRRASLSPHSSLGSRAELLVPCEVVELQRAGEAAPTVTLSQCTAVEAAWLKLWFPGDLRTETSVSFDETDKRVVARQELWFRDLLLESKRGAQPSQDQAAAILAEAVLAGKIVLKGWDHAADQLILRINFLAARRPELGFTEIGEEERRLLIEEVCRGEFSAKDIREKPVAPAIRSWLDYAQQQSLDKLAPERIGLPSGRSARVSYEAGGEARVAATIQNLFGAERLAIDGGRYDLVLEVCAPNQRPIQVTRNLAGFWRDQYAKFRQEYVRKYPRHAWPEDPFNYVHPPPKPPREHGRK